MRKFRWPLLIGLAGLLIIGAILIFRPPTIENSDPQPVQGGAYIEGVVGSVSRLNPLLDFANPIDQDIDSLIFSGLVKIDSQGLPQPDVAEGWAISASGSLYTFFIREDAVWHDGNPILADDVIFTFSKFQDDDYPGQPEIKTFWQQISITKIDTRTVQFSLPEAFAPFLDYLTIGLLPDHLLRGVSSADLIDHPFNLEPVGSGPFRFDDFIMDEGKLIGVALVVNEDFYGNIPYLQRMEFIFYNNEQAASEALQAGDIHGLAGLSAFELEKVLSNNELNLYTTRWPSTSMVLLNLNHPVHTFFQEPDLRKALQYSINRQWLIDSLLNGQGIVASGPIIENSWAAPHDLAVYPYDTDEAIRLLDMLEWKLPVGSNPGDLEYLRSKDEVQLAFTLACSDDPLQEEIARFLQASWATIGIQVQITAFPLDELISEKLVTRDYEAVLIDLDSAGHPDPDPYPFWHEAEVKTGQNYSEFIDRNISIWLEEARTNPDIERRLNYYRRFSYRFKDQLPALLLYHPVYNYAVDRSFLGVSVGPISTTSDRFSSISAWYLSARISPVATVENEEQ